MLHRHSEHLLTLATALLLLSPAAAAAQTDAATITCTLTPAEAGVMAGDCQPTAAEVGPMKLREGGDGGTPIWVGILEVQGFELDVDLKRIEYAAGPVLALRTPLGWFPATLQRDGERLVVSFDDTELPPSAVDLRIIEAARQILQDESRWDREDDRVCEATDTTYSLYCAMQRATIEVTGEFHHRQPALQVVRVVVQDLWSERYTEHRLMDFNNHADTTLDDIQATFAEAEKRARAAQTQR